MPRKYLQKEELNVGWLTIDRNWYGGESVIVIEDKGRLYFKVMDYPSLKDFIVHEADYNVKTDVLARALESLGRKGTEKDLGRDYGRLENNSEAQRGSVRFIAPCGDSSVVNLTALRRVVNEFLPKEGKNGNGRKATTERKTVR